MGDAPANVSTVQSLDKYCGNSLVIGASTTLAASVDAALRSCKLFWRVGVCRALIVKGVLAREFYMVLVLLRLDSSTGHTANAPIIRVSINVSRDETTWMQEPNSLVAGISSPTEGVGGAFSSNSVRNVSSLAIPLRGVIALRCIFYGGLGRVLKTSDQTMMNTCTFCSPEYHGENLTNASTIRS